MRSRSVIPLIVLALTALGAPALSEEGPAVIDRDDIRGEQLRLADCEQQVAIFPIDAGQAEPYLPDGFEPIAFQDSSPEGPTGAPAPPGADATLQLTATSCAVERGPGANERDVTILQAWMYVTPPAAYRDPGAGLGPTPSPYLVVPWVGTSDAAVTREFSRWGLPAETIEVSNAFGTAAECPPDAPPFCPAAPEIRTGAVDATAQTFTVALNTLVPVVDRVVSPEHLRLFGVRDGEVTGVVDFVEEAHTHLMIGGSQAVVTGATPFPAPGVGGLSLHVEPGYGLTFVPVRTPPDRRDR